MWVILDGKAPILVGCSLQPVGKVPSSAIHKSNSSAIHNIQCTAVYCSGQRRPRATLVIQAWSKLQLTIIEEELVGHISSFN